MKKIILCLFISMVTFCSDSSDTLYNKHIELQNLRGVDLFNAYIQKHADNK